ncbi:hypothetical protein K438DRAFT_1777588 [Mycena galopus ATCC 62051]|nr:hypothetical protein K438DRAFT_1777588 [Mycena galopus ATCC 62051]
MDPEDTPDPTRTCSQSKCKSPASVGFGTCKRCREKNTQARREKRTRAKEAKEANEARKHKRSRLETQVSRDDDENQTGPESDDEIQDSQNTFTQYRDQQDLLSALRDMFKASKHVNFYGTYQTPTDPLITENERVQMTVLEIWKVTGYRFRVKENKSTATGHRTRLWCCQDRDRKQKPRPSTREGAKTRDTLGMHRFDCKSRLRVSCLDEEEGQHKISISLRHLNSHVPYYDVSLPPEAAAIIRDGIEWSTPVQMVGRIQNLFPNVTAGQVHSAWSEMSEILWKRDPMQFASAQILLGELGDDVDVLDVHPAEGLGGDIYDGQYITLRGFRIEIWSLNLRSNLSLNFMARVETRNRSWMSNRAQEPDLTSNFGPNLMPQLRPQLRFSHMFDASHINIASTSEVEAETAAWGFHKQGPNLGLNLAQVATKLASS